MCFIICCLYEVNKLLCLRKDLNRGRESFSSEASALVIKFFPIFCVAPHFEYKKTRKLSDNSLLYQRKLDKQKYPTEAGLLGGARKRITSLRAQREVSF